MIVKLLTEHHLEFLSLKGGCRGSPESTYVKMPHCWKFYALAHISFCLRSESNMAGVYEDASELEKLIHECGKYMIIHYSLVILH